MGLDLALKNNLSVSPYADCLVLVASRQKPAKCSSAMRILHSTQLHPIDAFCSPMTNSNKINISVYDLFGFKASIFVYLANNINLFWFQSNICINSNIFAAAIRRMNDNTMILNQII